MTTALGLLVGVAAFLAVVELWFRRWHRRTYGRDYFVALRFPWDENHVVAHPFLTFAYRRNGAIRLNQRLPYALAPNRYFSFHEPLALNSIGHFGPDLTLEKPPRTLRVACLGSSGVANTIADGSRAWCWPQMLQEQLKLRFAADPRLSAQWDDVEVMNGGIGGWTMLDVFVDFSLNITPYRPDVVVIYQGLNDLPLHLMKGYSFDYAHGRRNLGERLHVIRRGYLFPKLRWWHSYEWLRDRSVGTGNIRNEVLAAVETQAPDYAAPYRPLDAEEQALNHILDLCAAHGIAVVIGTYCFFDHSGSARNVKLREGVDLENALFRKVAGARGLPLVEIDETIPKDAAHFVDAVHFSPQGMDFVAARFGEAVARLAADRP